MKKTAAIIGALLFLTGFLLMSWHHWDICLYVILMAWGAYIMNKNLNG